MTDLLSPETRRELERLRFETKRVPPGGRVAERNSRQRGSGVEFVDFRGYTPGDDFRAVDWHAYVKHDKLMVKLYEEPQDLPVYILLDASRSMQESAGDGAGKWLFARRLAAAFCYIVLVSEDRVAVLPFADTPLPPLRPLSGRRVVNRALEFLGRVPSAGSTHLTRAIERFTARGGRRGIVILISDFFTQDHLAAALNAVKHLRHDVALILVHDPTEVARLPEGDLLLEDSETGETVAVTITPQARQAYADAYERFAAEIEGFCRSHGAFFVRADLTDSVVRIVAEIVRKQGTRGWGRNL